MKTIFACLLLFTFNVFASSKLNGPIVTEPIVLNDDTKYVVSLPYECLSDEYVEVSVNENNVIDVKCAKKICVLSGDSRGVYSRVLNKVRLGIYLRAGVKQTLLKNFKGTTSQLESEIQKTLDAKVCASFVNEEFDK